MGSNNKTDKKTHKQRNFDCQQGSKHVMSSDAEAEIGAVFINAKEGALLRKTLEESGHTHPPHQWKQIIPLPQDTAMVQFKKNAQKPWICIFIG
jgi:hypothetical protein